MTLVRVFQAGKSDCPAWNTRTKVIGSRKQSNDRQSPKSAPENRAEQNRISPRSSAWWLVVSFNQAALFHSGKDVISPDAMEGLEKVAAAMRKVPNPVRLEGHTDSIPIRTARFRSNWELSAARSIALMELLSTRFGVPQERLSVAGYADTAPIDTNETPEGRARNRRVDIVLLNEQGVIGEPEKLDRK